ncbi:hypothetical protein Lacal_2255 [Lacinutrix sp. 5H-3-7-4]|nr:hypothetical protein Lacal_2255 [Lacinutrix sp. 5H-3-7-4]
MEDFFSNIPIKKILASIFIIALVFNAFIKERFLLDKADKKSLQNLSNLTNNKLSGRLVMAIIYFTIALIAVGIGLIIYRN